MVGWSLFGSMNGSLYIGILCEVICDGTIVYDLDNCLCCTVKGCALVCFMRRGMRWSNINSMMFKEAE